MSNVPHRPPNSIAELMAGANAAEFPKDNLSYSLADGPNREMHVRKLTDGRHARCPEKTRAICGSAVVWDVYFDVSDFPPDGRVCSSCRALWEKYVI